jgi:two-component system cell cycle sensor histidine kinase/response regulator CckA
MPGIKGTEMVKQVLPNYPDVKVIFMSGYAEDVFSDSFGDDRTFEFLAKPFTLNALASKVKEVVEG